MKSADHRDRVVEQLLRQSPPTASSAETPECLDAETMAAWADGELSGAALTRAESHVASCARCQSIAAALLRSEPPPSVAERSPRRWFAWLVPLTAAATAIAIWVAVPHDSERTAPAPMVSDAVTPQPASPTDVPSPSAQSPSQGFATPAPRPQERRERAPATAESPQRLETAPPSTAQAKAAEPAAAGALSDAQARAASSPAAPSTPSPAASLNETITLARAPDANAGVRLIASPDSTRRWRLAGTVVEYSTDDGSTWTDVFTARAPLTAGTSPSSSICWIVGRNGVVLRTLDGRSFSVIPVPETVDLTTVGATEADVAAITAADGRVFSTVNGGQSWTVR